MGTYKGEKINSFNKFDSFLFETEVLKAIEKIISNEKKKYILSVEEEKYIDYLVEQHYYTPLSIDFDNEIIEEPRTVKEEIFNRYGIGTNYVEAYEFTIKYPFTGSHLIFSIKPRKFVLKSRDIYIDKNQNLVSFEFTLNDKDPELFFRAKDSMRDYAFANLENANEFANNWNKELKSKVASLFQVQKKKYQAENDFFAAINLKVDSKTKSVFTAPTIRKKRIPQPKVSQNKVFSMEPSMAKEMYDDILEVVYNSGKSMELKPSTYKGKDEEALRDQFLLFLEMRYEGVTASGETFNRGGKTDILMKYSKNNSNIFVAECKFWHGASEFLKAISQLFDRYLSWRDSKTALILFVKNSDFTNVLSTMKTKTKEHPYYVKENGIRGESSFSYIFHLPQDPNKQVFFEIMAFHYDKE